MKKLISLITLLPTVLIAQFDNIEDPKRLGGTVNTMAEENFPIFLKSDGSLYFTRTFDDDSKYGPNDQNVWRSDKVGEQSYQKGTEVKKINNKFNNCIVGFNSDETKIYLLNSYDGKKDLKKGICYSLKKGDSWSKPKSIEIPGLDI
jgi:hypothetical protein